MQVRVAKALERWREEVVRLAHLTVHVVVVCALAAADEEHDEYESQPAAAHPKHPKRVVVVEEFVEFSILQDKRE